MTRYQFRCKLYKTGEITIPAFIRKAMKLNEGDIIQIDWEGTRILVTPKLDQSLINEVIVGRKGVVHIPVEIRRLLQLKPHTFFQGYVELSKKIVVIEPI